MHESVDYFRNHQKKLHFPWALYHRPIVRAFGSALGASLGPEVLNVGSGPFLEFSELDARGRQITVCDVDERAIEATRALYGPLLHGADVLHPGAPLPYETGRFDLVVSMDVIEHLAEGEILPWLRELHRVTKPGGLIFLTTPNYASKALVLLENTALELIARLQGFSRKDLHPSKMTPARLREWMRDSGWTRIDLRLISYGWVLAASAHKAADSATRGRSPISAVWGANGSS
jgi:2-polyprenyl-3-methyl-5-hydroxy-6-metoxy-1,4-benzoquinol methylase